MQLTSHDTVLLFVYGQLKYELPDTTSYQTTDSVQGRLYALPNGDAALIDLGSPDAMAHGLTIRIDRSELPVLDREEAPEYRRQVCTTKAGHYAYVYSFVGKLPKSAKEVKVWKPE